LKVLKKGTGQKGWAKKFTCTGYGNGEGGCGAVLLIEEADLFKQRSILGGTTDYVSFECCECGVGTDVWNSERPPLTNGLSYEVASRITRGRPEESREYKCIKEAD